MNSKKTWIALGALIVAVALMLGVFVMTRPEEKPDPTQASQTEETKMQITVTVVHSDGTEKVFTCHTIATTLDRVLLDEGIIPEGNIVDGMFTTVDGETASWTADQAYWAFYMGDDYASVGICDATVTDGASYKLVYEKSNW